MSLETSLLAPLGWSDSFARQITPHDLGAPHRVSAVHRARLEALGPEAVSLALPPTLSAGDVTVGDWVLALEGRVTRVLPRRTTLTRRAAGPKVGAQVMAANLDTTFIVTSCNADFNEARLGRFLALAHAGGVAPVLVATKADRTDEAAAFLARLEAVAAGAACFTLNAKDPASAAVLLPWCGPGQTVALIGTSGVGKSTLINALTGRALATGAIREDDARGRHTTTARSLVPLAGGGWLIDTPGIREVQLAEDAEGAAAAFDDLAQRATDCRFSDCRHGAEPGCSLRADVEAGTLSPARLAQFRKLLEEERAPTWERRKR